MVNYRFYFFGVIIAVFTIIQAASLCAMRRNFIRILRAKPSYLLSLDNKSLNIRWYATENSKKPQINICRLNRCAKIRWALGGGLVTFMTQDLLRAMIVSGKDALYSSFILQEKEQN